MVKELTGSKSEIVSQPLPQDDPVRRRPDITLAKATLHWEPSIPLRDGVGGRGNPLPAPMARCLPFTENIPIIKKRI